MGSRVHSTRIFFGRHQILNIIWNCLCCTHESERADPLDQKKGNMIQESHINMSSESVLNVKRRHEMDIDSQEPTVGLLLLKERNSVWVVELLKEFARIWNKVWSENWKYTRRGPDIAKTVSVPRMLPIHSQHEERGVHLTAGIRAVTG